MCTVPDWELTEYAHKEEKAENWTEKLGIIIQSSFIVDQTL